jgi:hypothetical protein
MLDLIKEFAVFCITWYAVIVAVRILLTLLYVKLSNSVQADTELIEKLNKLVHSVTVEQISGIEYWYDQDSGEFIAQGHSQEEIVAVLKHAWHGHVFLLNERHILAAPDYTPIPLEQLRNHLKAHNP